MEEVVHLLGLFDEQSKLRYLLRYQPLNLMECFAKIKGSVHLLKGLEGQRLDLD